MFETNNFSKDFFFKSKKFNYNLKKTQKLFKTLKSDIKNFKIPLLESYKKNYKLDFSAETIKKFSRYKNVIVVGMGGSILGAKCIHSFFEKKNKKKNVFF